jgi:signal transduction histidine kinase
MLAQHLDHTGFFFVLDEPARILVADDDPILREFACVHLATPEVTLDTAGDGAEALTKLEAGGYDLALVDLDMPVMDGFELIARIRSTPALRHLPVVVVTGREDMVAIDKAFQAGATSFAVKPLNWRLLSYQLRYVLRAFRQENEIRVAKQRAEQAHAIKTNILRLVQHELRTPLTSIVGFAEHIESHPKSSEVAEFAGLIAGAGRRFSSNVSDLIAAAQTLTSDIVLRPDDIRVPQIIDAVVAAEATRAADKGVPLRGVDGTRGMRIECDRDLVVRALRHIVRNAIEHGEGPVDLMATPDRDGVAFAVRDRGPGIEAARLEQCLAAFEQGEDALNRSSAGFGLGLPVAQRVFSAHGGALSVSHTPDVGCIVVATLPARPPEQWAAG